jgi:hypothetical protein
MASGHSRKGFFQQLARDLGRVARELDEALRPDTEEDQFDGLYQPEPPETQTVVPASGTSRTATLDDVRRFCNELGLDDWADAAVAAAVPSIRLIAVETGQGSKLGGTTSLPLGVEWPTWTGRALDLVLQVSLAEMPPSALPRAGTLLVFFATEGRPDGSEPRHREACRVLFVPDGTEVAPHPRPEALPVVDLSASVELTLPLDPPGDDDDSCDYERWMELRSRLAAFQGVVLEDESPDYHAVHRLLGHPDTLAFPMDVEAAELEGGDADAWRLLAQLSADDRLGVTFGHDERLFVWIRADDLGAHRFDRVRAFVR